MALGPQVQLLRSGDKGKAAFRKINYLCSPHSMIANHLKRTELDFPDGSMWGGQVALHSNISGPCRPKGSAAGHGAHPGAGPPPPSKPRGHPAVPLLSTAAVSPGKPFCHLLSHQCGCPYTRTKCCRSEPSLS